jgi:hypothetical protein
MIFKDFQIFFFSNKGGVKGEPWFPLKEKKEVWCIMDSIGCVSVVRSDRNVNTR